MTRVSRNDVEMRVAVGHTLAMNLLAPISAIAMYSLTIFKLDGLFLGDGDTYWHVTTGQWIIKEHSIPRYDIFSHTFVGKPWIDGEWLSQVILALSYMLSGWRGVVLASALLVSLTYILLYKLLTRILRS